MNLKPDPLEDFLTLGRYKLDKDYEFFLYENSNVENLVIFNQGFELSIFKTNEFPTYCLKAKVFALSPFFLLTLEKTDSNNPEILQIINARSFIYLNSITLKRYIDDSLSNTLILKWKNEELQIICLNNDDVHKFIEILRKVSKVPVIQNLKKIKYVRPIQLKEVNSNAYKSMDPNELESSIQVFEKSIEIEKYDSDNPKIVEKIKALLELYKEV